MADEHLDHALSEEFGSQIAAVHRLKASNAHFRTLMERNHALWKDIQKIQSGIAPADDFTLEDLEKRRLVILDEIAAMLAKA
jgi:uncharacterized protein